MTHPIGDATARRRFIRRSIWWTVPGVGRAPGVQMTFTINIASLAAVLALLVRSL